MKKIVALLMALCMLGMFCACGTPAETTPAETETEVEAKHFAIATDKGFSPFDSRMPMAISLVSIWTF